LRLVKDGNKVKAAETLLEDILKLKLCPNSDKKGEASTILCEF